MNDAPRLVIVGGSDAGISAALRARELDPAVRPTLVVADASPNFSICGIPYWLSGEVTDKESLAHRTRHDLERAGLDLQLNTIAERIDIAYDSLVIATGALPVRPPIPGIELDGVHLLHSMDDATVVHAALTGNARSAVIVGAGYIGVEMADALTRRGLEVSLIKQAPSALTTVDPELGALVVQELTAQGVRCSFGGRVTGVERHGNLLIVTGQDGTRARADIVLFLAGVTPGTQLAQAAGASLGVRGAIAVDRQMRTCLPDIWAAGDCVHAHRQLLDEPAHLPLGSNAHKPGRVAGENAIGGSAEFAGSLGTQAVKVFDLVIAATGLRETARDEGFDPLTVATTADDHKASTRARTRCTCGSSPTATTANRSARRSSDTSPGRSPSASTRSPSRSITA